MGLMGGKMTLQTLPVPIYSITVAAVLIERLLARIFSATVTALIMCSMLDLPHVIQMVTHAGEVKAALVAEAMASFFLMALEML
jgi:hypothetical protein